ncbi:MAG TPA: toxin [Spirochaetes bacterium]|nr:toxin [Spirochaetota bacterium]
MMKKNDLLKAERNVSFEDVLFYIDKGNLLAIVEHPDRKKYPGQKMYIVEIDHYAYLVPFVETDTEVFLKTVIPSRKATKKYLGEKDEK